MKKQLKKRLEKRVAELIGNEKATEEKIIRKLSVLNHRNAKIVKVTGEGKVVNGNDKLTDEPLEYQVHMTYLIRQGESLYVEEEIEFRQASFHKGKLSADSEVLADFKGQWAGGNTAFTESGFDRVPFIYDRLKAVQYAERWWNDYNPAYEQFEVDCTNYISQCLHAGGAPMRGYSNRTKGWWYQHGNWSFSWSVANALRLYLQHSTTGLRAKEVYDPLLLKLGDVICYDFQGDGRFDHNTIVTGKDAVGMPLVNAHTYNSRMRYWAYEDSTAYTPNIQYKMFTIIDDETDNSV